VQCNPALSALITETLQLERIVWLKDLTKLEGLLAHVNDTKFQDRWAAVKHQNKERLSLFVERQLGVKVDADAMFDVQIKRLHEYKRQSLNIFGVIHVRGTHSAELASFFTVYAEVPGDQEHDPRGTQESCKKSGVLRWKSRPCLFVPSFSFLPRRCLLIVGSIQTILRSS
jgi:hypothetical protein